MHRAARLLQDMIRCDSVTPARGAIFDLLEKELAAAGFECHRLVFSDKDTPDVENLYAKRGSGLPHFAFAGHVDVVPPGDAALWRAPPFSATLDGEDIIGRGAVDMKGSIAAALAAAESFVPETGAISFIISGDEEGPGINGTRKIMQWLAARGEKIDFCLLGEPTSREKIGDTMKIGRRGSLTGFLTVTGKQGHAAYPHLADNPLPKMVGLLAALDRLELDKGTAHFQPSNLEIVTIDTGNTAFNVIPAAARAVFNIRFNDAFTGESLRAHIRRALDACGVAYDLTFRESAESFYTPPGKYSEMVSAAVRAATGLTPEATTGGGLSDAKDIKDYCPVIEFGPVGATMHQIDERIGINELEKLTEIYRRLLELFFKSA